MDMLIVAAMMLGPSLLTGWGIGHEPREPKTTVEQQFEFGRSGSGATSNPRRGGGRRW